MEAIQKRKESGDGAKSDRDEGDGEQAGASGNVMRSTDNDASGAKG